jgi:hypothetical protein
VFEEYVGLAYGERQDNLDWPAMLLSEWSILLLIQHRRCTSTDPACGVTPKHEERIPQSGLLGVAGQILWALSLAGAPQDVQRSVVVTILERDSLALGGTTPPQASHFVDRAIGTPFCHSL